MKNKIELNEVLQLDSLVALGKKEGLKYFKKVNKEYSVQDLCKHWQISSATFYSKYAKQIGHKPKSRSKTKVNFTLKDNEIIDTKLKNKENLNPIHMDIIPDIVKNKETTTALEEGLTEIINNKIEDNNLIDNQNKVCTTSNLIEINNEKQYEENIRMEQIFRMFNCSDLSKMQEMFNMINTIVNQQSIYDIELRMIEK